MTFDAQDAFEITQLMAEYNWALDTQDLEAFAETFTETGVFDGASGIYRGRTEVVEMARKSRAGDGALRTQHIIGNSLFSGTDERAVVRSASLGPALHDGVFTMTFQGYYVDIAVKVDGRWLFEHRRWRHFTGPVTEHAEFPWGGMA